MPTKKRVVFFAEAVTLAHVARPVVLARALDRDRYDAHLAWDPRYARLFPDLGLPERRIYSIPSEQFGRALAKGSPLYDAATLRRYVREDLQVLEELSPDLIVGDFRLSLAVSAALAGATYIAIGNAYWSPYARQRFPVPDLPVARFFGVSIAQLLFNIVRPFAFAYHTLPLNRVRREYGLPTLGLDLRRVYTWADHTVYADDPGLFSLVDPPANHHFLGPILWSPSVSPPPWWGSLPEDRPAVYVTLGSSGRGELLPAVLAALAELPVAVMAATANRVRLQSVPPNAYIADYLPGEAAAARSDLVICNGGAPTTQQALVAGVPVLGIANNLDQHLNMAAVQRAGAGKRLRSESANAQNIKQTVAALLEDPAYAAAARRLAAHATDAPKRFAELVEQVV